MLYLIKKKTRMACSLSGEFNKNVVLYLTSPWSPHISDRRESNVPVFSVDKLWLWVARCAMWLWKLVKKNTINISLSAFIVFPGLCSCLIVMKTKAKRYHEPMDCDS